MTTVRIKPASPPGVGRRWEEQYQSTIRGTDDSGRARLRELTAATDQAFQRITATLAQSQFAAGVMVGAVQSGKTSLMINLAARALDSRFRLVVVLAGLKDDLRTQTALRFTKELLHRGDSIPGTRDSYTHPAGQGYHGERRDCWALRFDEDVNQDEAFLHLFLRALERGHQVLVVTKKNVSTLTKLREAIDTASPLPGSAPWPMMVLDDECDEASVSGDEEAPTPSRIAQLWAGLGGPVVYVGLTATPAANLLQAEDSELFPSSFILPLKTPAGQESQSTYLEPEFNRRYTGGHAFYRLLEMHERNNFLVRGRMSDSEFQGVAGADDELEEALIAYFVAGAIRLGRRDRYSFTEASRLPPPHTMIAHTESTVESHWRLCERIARIVCGKAGRPLPTGLNLRTIAPTARLSEADLGYWLASEPARWKDWYASFALSREELGFVVPDRTTTDLPTWEEVEELLPFVFSAVKLRVVNSDDSSSDRPLGFEVGFGPQGSLTVPEDVYSIIIGGNRLSRGLTIEGLCISYYTRASALFLEDTTTQRERWFGYRGPHLEFCRVFTHRSIAIRLQCFHEHEEDLRRQVSWAVGAGKAPCDATFRFLTTRDSLPTAKLGRGTAPMDIDIAGSRPFVDRVQMGESEVERQVAQRNESKALALSNRILQQGETLYDRAGKQLGVGLFNLPPEEIASLLDGFEYTTHNPDPTKGVAWNLREFYRLPVADLDVTPARLPPRADPLLIAAYLRYWGAAFQVCQEDPSKNDYRSADTTTRWSPCAPPHFNVAVRFGSLTPTAESLFRFPLLNRSVDSTGLVGSRWGGRGYGQPGDEWIDMAPPDGNSDVPRNHGLPGLMLLHVIGRDASGRDGCGSTYHLDRPCVGLVIPLGGPCIRFVLTGGH